MNQIILIGFMGAGKTTIGKALAKSLNREFADTDERIEADTGRKIPDIFEKEGEPYFRRLETETLQKLEKEEIPRVIAVGGGLPMQPENGPILNRMGTVVFLEADTDTLEARLRGDTSRPKLQGGELRERILTLMREREETYRQVAHLSVRTDHRSVDEVTEEIKERISSER